MYVYMCMYIQYIYIYTVYIYIMCIYYYDYYYIIYIGRLGFDFITSHSK